MNKNLIYNKILKQEILVFYNYLLRNICQKIKIYGIVLLNVINSMNQHLIMLLGILLVSVDLFLYKIDKICKISLLDFVLSRAFDDHGDMSKARQYGWTTTIDTNECYIQCFNRLKQMEVIPSD